MFAYLYNLSQFIANLYFSSTYLFQTGVLTRQTFEVIDFQYNLDPQVGTYYKYTYILYVFYTVHKYILYSSIGIHAESHGILNDKYISFDVGRYLIGHVVGFECHLRLVNFGLFIFLDKSSPGRPFDLRCSFIKFFNWTVYLLPSLCTANKK